MVGAFSKRRGLRAPGRSSVQLASRSENYMREGMSLHRLHASNFGWRVDPSELLKSTQPSRRERSQKLVTCQFEDPNLVRTCCVWLQLF
jgi:hypothetical protein